MRFRLSLVFAFLVAAPHVFAEAAASVKNTLGKTEIGGEVSGFLRKDNSPYQVVETLVLNEGKALVVEAGVTIEFSAGAGLDIRGGSIAVVGEPQNQVVFTNATGSSNWNGVTLTGQHRASFQNVSIQNAIVALSVENGSAELKNVEIERASEIGLYTRAALVDVQWSSFKNNKIAVWADNDSYVNSDASVMYSNHVAVIAGEASILSLQTTKVAHNDIGMIDLERNNMRQLRSQVELNKVGILSNDLPPEMFKKITVKNQKNFEQGVESAMAELPTAPMNPYSENFNAVQPSKPVDLSGWRTSGMVGLTGGYHKVWTKHNHSGEDYVVDSDTVKDGELYNNYFQVPGFFGELDVSMSMEDDDGHSLEFAANLLTDSWTHFNPENVSAIYTDRMQRLAVGDIYLSSGETYMAGVNVLGGSYDLNLFHNAANEPLFVASVFGGESKKPKAYGSRNEDVYKDHIEDGDIEPQELLIGGKLRWNMHRRFNGTLGFIGSKDYVEDPLLRDGSSPNLNTASPIVSSKTFFADGNWLFFPGDIELNGQVAVGAADTANVLEQRAINQVFVDAGLNASDFAKLRRLMANSSLVDNLTVRELEDFFGDNTMMTTQEMKAKLKSLLAQAKSVKNSYEAKEESAAEIKSWDGQNYAFRGSLRWDLGNTILSGYMRFVGSDFYSAASPDLLQNSREVFGNLDQKIADFWGLTLNYKMSIENAAKGTAYNIFGLAEGEKTGILPGAEDSWLKKHEQDEERTLYEHDANLINKFKVGQKLDVKLGYNMNYRLHSTNQRLYADYSATSGVYNDGWFKPRKGKEREFVLEGDDTLWVDRERWEKYYNLKNEPYLATQFEERLMKNTVDLELKFNLPKNVLKIGGAWTFRTDLSRFEQDDLLDGLGFSDETFGILGYYFHGGDYFEQRYPISLNTTLGGFRNMLAVTPRYKIYNRDDMTDFEWVASESMTIPLSRDFLDLLLSGSFRQEFLGRDEGDRRLSEFEMDVAGAGTLRFTHTDNFTSEWTVGTYCAYRPDSRADEYKDLYGMVSLNYAF